MKTGKVKLTILSYLLSSSFVYPIIENKVITIVTQEDN